MTDIPSGNFDTSMEPTSLIYNYIYIDIYHFSMEHFHSYVKLPEAESNYIPMILPLLLVIFH